MGLKCFIHFRSIMQFAVQEKPEEAVILAPGC